jgi:multiple sugar transport system permease protein
MVARARTDPPRVMPGHERRSRAIRQVIAVPLAVVFLLPMWLLIVGSLRPRGMAPPRSVQWWPASPAWINFVEVFDVVPIGRYAMNSMIVAAVAVPVSVVVASWTGFAIARLPRRARTFLIGVCVVVLMIPATSLLVGRVSVFRWLGLTDTLIPLMAPSLIGMSPLFVLLFAWSFWRLPEEMYDLAKEAGLSPFATWWAVALPQVRPAAGAVAALAFLISWGNFLDPLIYVYDERWFTLPLGLRSLSTLNPPNQPLMLAGALMACVPVVLAFAAMQGRLAGGDLTSKEI